VYPVLFTVGDIAVSSFSVMVLLAFLVAYILAEPEFKRKGLDGGLVDLLLIAAVIGGLGGAKIMFLYQQVPITDFIHDPMRYMSSGFTFQGGLIGAIFLAWLVTQMKRVPFLVVTDLASPLLVIAYAVGRVGCLLVGDDYGTPTNLPWAMAFPDGSPPTFERVHPTQIYDTVCMLILFAVLWKIRKRDYPTGWLTAVTIIALGAQRFLVEFLRETTPSFIPGLSQAQIISIVLVITGVIMLRKIKKRPAAAAGNRTA
jgi:phosphatidylglycerol---prolipoprotein diacylglyceryl transferase